MSDGSGVDTALVLRVVGAYQANLAEEQRQVWASLPAFERLAAVWLVLASEDYSHYGTVFAAEMLVAGVKGMPPITSSKAKGYPHGPAEAFMQKFNEDHGHEAWKSKVDKLVSFLPPGYGKKVGEAVFKEALVLTRNPHRADELFGQVFEAFYKGGGEHLKAEHNFESAIKYIKNSVKNAFLNLKKRQDREQLIDEGPEGVGPEILSPRGKAPEGRSDAALFEMILKELHSSPELQRELKKIHPDAAMWLQLMVEGHDSEKIVGDWRTGTPSMLPHLDQSSRETGLTPQAWNATQRKKILEVARKHMEKIHERRPHEVIPYGHKFAYDYDRRAGVSTAA